jgi:hypothetical protein
MPIGSMDPLIAAYALSLAVRLVTNNTREFRRVSGLRVENWPSEGIKAAILSRARLFAVKPTTTIQQGGKTLRRAS